MKLTRYQCHNLKIKIISPEFVIVTYIYIKSAPGLGKSVNSTSYHTIHEYELELVLVKGLVAVLVVGRPDVAGDGRCHSGVSVPVARVSQERAFVIQQAGQKVKMDTLACNKKLLY